MSAGRGNEESILNLVREAAGEHEANRLSIELGLKKRREE